MEFYSFNASSYKQDGKEDVLVGPSKYLIVGTYKTYNLLPRLNMEIINKINCITVM